MYREHPTGKIQIATWTSSWFGAWGHSDFETNQHQLQFLHNFRWYLTVPFRCNWWRTERKLGKISNSNCPGWWKHRHLYIYSDYIWRHKVKHSFCNKHIMLRCHRERNSRCSVGGVGKRGVQPKKIMSLGSDGASVMTGKEKGLFSSIFALLVLGSQFLLWC